MVSSLVSGGVDGNRETRTSRTFDDSCSVSNDVAVLAVSILFQHQLVTKNDAVRTSTSCKGHCSLEIWKDHDIHILSRLAYTIKIAVSAGRLVYCNVPQRHVAARLGASNQ